MDLERLFKIASENAAMLFKKQEYVSPMWHAVMETGEQFVVSTPWDSELEKDLAVQLMRNLFREKHVERYAFIAEAWTVQIKVKKDDVLHIRASAHPDRREVVGIVAEDRNGQCISGRYYILRPEHGPPKLSKLHNDSDFQIVTGRVSSMFDNPSVH